jgi:hypothetical protein
MAGWILLIVTCGVTGAFTFLVVRSGFATYRPSELEHVKPSRRRHRASAPPRSGLRDSRAKKRMRERRRSTALEAWRASHRERALEQWKREQAKGEWNGRE